MICVTATAMLGATIDGRWELGVGDPTVIGWFTVFAYFVVSILCAVQSRRCCSEQRLARTVGVSDTILWMSLALLLALLGINKQLDLQTALTQYGRDLAIEQGWYEQRHAVQQWFVAVVAFTGFAGMCVLAWACRGSLQRNFLAGIGIMFLVCFVVIRAASFHHVDKLLGWRGFSVPANAIFELSGIGCVMLAAIVRLARSDDRSTDPST